MKVGIIGLGIVGSALQRDFKDKRIELSVFDKYKNIGDMESCVQTEICFLCLPTNLTKENEFDLSALNEVLTFLSKNEYDGNIIIKSTTLPGTSKMFLSMYKNLDIFHNPEFLSEKSAFYHINHQTHIVIGKTKNIQNVRKIQNFYSSYYSNAIISICSSDESETMKLCCNAFYASKIQLFNEIYFFCKKSNIQYENVKKMMLNNNWINPMHTNVPGHDGKLGFGGKCFPKDLVALINFCKKKKIPCNVLESVNNENEVIRNNK